MASQVWVVFHRSDGWTHVYRTDDRDSRLVHLVDACEGDRCESLLAAARRRFALAENHAKLAA